MLEKGKDLSKYFLKEKQLNNIIHWKSQQNPLDKVSGKNTICPTITTRVAESCDGGISASMIVVSDKFEDTTNVRKEIIKLGNYSKSNHNATNILSPLGSAQTVMECHGSIQAVAIPIKNATKKGYLLAEEEEDGIDISTRMESHRGTVQKGMSQTLKTQCEVGVIQKKPINESDLIGGFGEKGSTNQYRTQNRIYSSSSPTLSTAFNPYFLEDYGIRKLTPRECFRLMGVRDYDIDKLEHKFTDQQKWHLAGDSIVVNVLYYIFKQMI
jgi:DNA (cytosine-5)-methyltransferase 1